MALSNKFGWLVLKPATRASWRSLLHPLRDTAGGFAAIKDVPKTLVYRLCRWRNSPTPVVRSGCSPNRPPRSFAGQLDTDSLPPYEHLDLSWRRTWKAISLRPTGGSCFARPWWKRVVRLVDTAEYKRRQSPIGVGNAQGFRAGPAHAITNGYR